MYPSQSPERMREYQRKWAKKNRDKINAARRKRRALKLLSKLEGKKCLNCEVLLSARLDWKPGRTYLYCRKCITEHPEEVNRDKCRRAYWKKKGHPMKVIKPTTSPYIQSWSTLKQVKIVV